VDYFLNHKIGFLDIAQIIERTLNTVQHTHITSLEDAIANDKATRETTLALIKKYA